MCNRQVRESNRHTPVAFILVVNQHLINVSGIINIECIVFVESEISQLWDN